MVKGYGDSQDFTNRRLPEEEKFQTRWIDFPNYLQSEPVILEDDESIAESTALSEAGRYLPFISQSNSERRRHEQRLSSDQRWKKEPRVPLQQLEETRRMDNGVTPQLVEPERMTLDEPAVIEKQNITKDKTIDEMFPTFRQQANRRKNAEEWRAFLQEKPLRKPRFVPSRVPSILKGLPEFEIKRIKEPAIDYQRLEQLLLPNPDDLLLFVNDDLADDKQKNSSILKAAPKREKASPHTKAFQSQTVPALKTPRLTSADATLLQATQVALEPLPGKQRRAMNRSLSWIMEQEQKQNNQTIPYV